MYTSSVIQNEIIELCGNAIQKQIIDKVRQSGFFAVLADEAQDVSRYEQLSLCLRYVDCSSRKALIREDFVGFVHIHDFTASALALTTMESLKSFGLDLENLVGQGYDEAAVMSERFKGNLRNERDFSNLFEEAKHLSSADLSVPRVTGRQINCSNIPGDTPEVYYRRNIFYPFIEHVVTEIEARFKSHEESISGIQLILPDRTQTTDTAKKCIARIGEIFLSEAEKKVVVSEYELWHNHWCNQEMPSTVLEAMDRCDELFFPTIRQLLQILATLPVSTATPETNGLQDSRL
ncbi:unnamed protein product [Ceutorhynchus assimilis]|uniref:DUF4371 domain-containing protein n=1 Tax=Ceutorhynchus assimilis TaxID=467358 RepID=A0A9N9MU26_9CUCU|nr:unnamed protein product [Ceutorhynchus assimilis]